MSELLHLHEAEVAAEEIDHLGHMNVRFYLERALAATRELAARHGLSLGACEELGAVLEVRDAFTRHYREQLVGAPLTVMGGVLAVRGDGLRVYHELLNSERSELSATFVQEVKLLGRDDRKPLPLPEMLAKSAGGALTSWPEHGRPRTLDLERTPPELTVDAAAERGLAMREPRTVRAEECDASGLFCAARYQELVWGGKPTAQRSAGVPLYSMDNGGKFGWATLESRGILLELPREGTRIQSFGGEVEIGRKTSCRHQWVFDLDSGRLLCTSSILHLAFDIGARRSIEIPAAIRRSLESDYHPDLR